MEINLYQVIGELYVQNLMLKTTGVFPQTVDSLQVPEGQAKDVLAGLISSADTSENGKGEGQT